MNKFLFFLFLSLSLPMISPAQETNITEKPVLQWTLHGDFSEGLAEVYDKNGMVGFCDKSGNLVIPCQWMWVYGFHEGLSGVKDASGKCGFIDKSGKIVIACIWKDVASFQEGLARVCDDNGNYGFIDKYGKVVIPCKWKKANSFSENVASVYDDKTCSYIDKSGKILFSLPYGSSHFTEGLACFKNEQKKWGFHDKSGNTVIQPVWKIATSFSDGVACVRDDSGKFGFIDKKGNVIISCKWEYASTFHDGLSCVKDENGKYGYIDKSGKVVIPCKWKSANEFSEGLATVQNEEGKYGVIDTSGALVIPFRELCITPFSEGLAFCEDADFAPCYIINKKGQEVKISGTAIHQEREIAQQTVTEQKPKANPEVTSKPVSTATTQPAAQPKNVKQQIVDVDLSIPTSGEYDKNTFVVVIGNEKYADEADVPFAENDARMKREYCQQTLGVSEKHIRCIYNATYNDFRKALSWLKQGLTAYSGNGRVIFYYAGHGIPDEADKSAYLLPVDGIGSDIESAYSLNKLYQSLSELPAQSVTVFLDACFSGSKREGGMMASARGVAIKAKPQQAMGKMVVFTAAQGDETAYPLKSQKHGLFTYFLLKKLQETKGNVTLGELSDYLTDAVKRESFDENNKIQTPSVNASSALANSWRSMKLR